MTTAPKVKLPDQSPSPRIPTPVAALLKVVQNDSAKFGPASPPKVSPVAGKGKK